LKIVEIGSCARPSLRSREGMGVSLTGPKKMCIKGWYQGGKVLPGVSKKSFLTAKLKHCNKALCDLCGENKLPQRAQRITQRNDRMKM